MAPPSPSSSSSGFSSSDDDDDEYEYERSTATRVIADASATRVPVEIVREDDDEAEDDAVMAQPIDENDDNEPLVDVDVESLAPHIARECLDTAAPLLQGPLSFHYELYTTAIELVTRSWPASSDEQDADEENGDDDPKVTAYHALRAALYARFQRAFPLTQEMYAQWLSDLPASDLAATQRVFELSFQDYQSVPLALQYAQFLQDNEGEANLPSAKSIMERLLRTVGVHYTQGHEVWKFYRELMQQDSANEEETKSPVAKEQQLRAFYLRQMKLPLQQNDLVMSEFRAWNNYNTLEPEAESRRVKPFEDAVKRQTKVFGPLLKKMSQFEERLQAAQAQNGLEELPLEQVWLQYINFVTYRIVPLMDEAQDDDDDSDDSETPTGDDLLKSMFERAVAMVCLSATLWSKYAAFLTSSPNASDADKLQVYQRAVRNVSFDSSMWNDLLLEMERQGALLTKISAFVENSILSRTNPLMMDPYHFLSVLITYCDVRRRHAARSKYSIQAMQQLEQAFETCVSFLETHFPEFAAGVTRIMEYHAKCTLLGSSADGSSATKFAKWNALWDQILQKRGHEAEVWVSYYQESVRTGAKKTPEEIRTTVFERAMQHVKDYPASVLEIWLVFERENGTLEHFLRVRQLHVDLVAKSAALVAAQSAEALAAGSEAAGASSQPESRKRKANDTKSKAEPKRAKTTPAPRQEKEQKQTKESQKPQKAAVSALTKVAEKSIEKKKTHEALTNAHTLFASNISKEVTKEELDALFQDIPGFKEVRLVVKARANHVKSRGMAYIQFSDEQGVEAGLLKNGLELKGQAMSIEKSKPPQSTTPDAGNKGKTGDLGRDGTWKTDPVTIYVGGLVPKENGGEHIGEAKLQQGIQQALQSVGELVVVKRVSILKDKRGKLKDYGLVEVASEEQTTKCVEHLDEIKKILGDQITLKPSRFSIDQILLQQQNQMKKKEKDPSTQGSAGNEKKSKGANKGNVTGAAAGAPGGAAANKSQRNSMSLMPRALRRKIAVSADPSSTSVSAKANSTPASSSAPVSSSNQHQQQAPTQSTAASDNKPKTNDDFRKLMMNQ